MGSGSARKAALSSAGVSSGRLDDGFADARSACMRARSIAPGLAWPWCEARLLGATPTARGRSFGTCTNHLPASRGDLSVLERVDQLAKGFHEGPRLGVVLGLAGTFEVASQAEHVFGAPGLTAGFELDHEPFRPTQQRLDLTLQPSIAAGQFNLAVGFFRRAQALPRCGGNLDAFTALAAPIDRHTWTIPS